MLAGIQIQLARGAGISVPLPLLHREHAFLMTYLYLEGMAHLLKKWDPKLG